MAERLLRFVEADVATNPQSLFDLAFAKISTVLIDDINVNQHHWARQNNCLVRVGPPNPNLNNINTVPFWIVIWAGQINAVQHMPANLPAIGPNGHQTLFAAPFLTPMAPPHGAAIPDGVVVMQLHFHGHNLFLNQVVPGWQFSSWDGRTV